MPSSSATRRFVVILLTDIVGSTRIWLNSPDAMHAAVQRHDEIVGEVVEAFGGTLVRSKGEGDSTFSVFDAAAKAVAAAAELQRRLMAEPWPTPQRISVRAALHAGEVEARNSDFFGPPIARAARLRAVSNGDQIIASQLVHDLCPASAEFGWRPLGLHALKDFPDPEPVFQATGPGLTDDFPPLTSSRSAVRMPNLGTRFIGRETELAEIVQSVRQHPVVTLVGPGGSGKTRLAIEASARLSAAMPDGVVFADLSGASDPSAVHGALAGHLGLASSSVEDLGRGCAEHHGMIVLDNCEHVVDVCADLIESSASRGGAVRWLATSQRTLGVPGECVRRVGPMPLPEPDATIDELRNCDSVKLFLDRIETSGRSGVADLALVAEVCRRLEGIPLAIELAAARVRSLGIAELARRLDDRLGLLMRVGPTSEDRHSTLRQAIDWSYELLTGEERTLFVRLGVFEGGFSLSAAESVAGQEPSSGLLANLEGLVDKSLVRLDLGVELEGRYHMLESLRSYAFERLSEGELADLRDRHAAYFSELGKQLGLVEGPGAQHALDEMSVEHANLHAAMIHLTGSPAGRESGLELASAMVRFWRHRGRLAEGRQALEALLAEIPFPGSLAEAKGFNARGTLALLQGDLDAARQSLEAAIDYFRSAGEGRDLASALNNLGLTHFQARRLSEAAACYREALETARGCDDKASVGNILNGMGMVAWAKGDLDEAIVRYREAVLTRRGLGDDSGVAESVLNSGLVEQQRGNHAEARKRIWDALKVFDRIHNRMGMSYALFNLADIARETGDREEAERYLNQAIPIFEEMRDRYAQTAAYVQRGRLLQQSGHLDRAREAFLEGLVLAEANGYRSWQQECLEELVQVCLESRDAEASAYCLGALLEFSPEGRESVATQVADLLRVTGMDYERLVHEGRKCGAEGLLIRVSPGIFAIP